MNAYKKISNKINHLIINNRRNEQRLEWINIVNAGKPEIEFLRKRYHFNLGHLRSSIATVFSQRPMILEEKDYLFLILHFPTHDKGRIVAGEVEFFLSHGYLITLSTNLPALTEFFNFSKKEPSSLQAAQITSSTILLYEILNKLINNCYQLLDANSLKINKVEELIFSGAQKAAVSRILELRRDTINIRRIVQNHKNILQKLIELKSSLVPAAEIKNRYHLLVDQSKQIWESLENQKEMIEAFNDTNQSLINNNINGIMKTLTIVTAMLLPLTLIADIFELAFFHNLPIFVDQRGFMLMLAAMLFSVLIMLWIFIRKKWLK